MAGRVRLLSAVLGLVCASTAFAVQVPAPDACTVLTLQELSAAAGVGVLRPRPESAQEGTACRFSAGTDTLKLAIGAAAPRTDFDALRKLLIDQGEPVEPVSGVGAGAFFWDNRIHVYTGSRDFSVLVGDAAPVSAKQRQMARAVAAALVARLK